MREIQDSHQTESTFGAGAAVRGDCGLLCWVAQPETIIAVVRQKVRNIMVVAGINSRRTETALTAAFESSNGI